MRTRNVLPAVCALSLLALAPRLAFAEFQASNFQVVSSNSEVPKVLVGHTGTSFSFGFANQSDLDTQAGGHPYEASTFFELTGGNLSGADVALPPGFIGNPQATPQCPLSQLNDPSDPCPAATQVGTVATSLETDIKPVYNLVPEPGVPAEFGFTVVGTRDPVILYGGVRTGGDYGITVSSSGVPQPPVRLEYVGLTFWGVPADHNGSGEPRIPFLTNPVDCAAGPLTTTLSVDAWQYLGEFKSYQSVSPPVSGCERLRFEPSISVTPETTRVDSPTGMTIDLRTPQTSNPALLATPELRNTTLTFPPGLAASPGAADGLQACSDAQFDEKGSSAAACPGASQLATVQIATPLLAEPAQGQLFLGSPLCSPCSSADSASGRTFRLFLQAQAAGVVIKLTGSVSADPVSGQLTARFDDAPQLPFSELSVHVKGGARAPLVNATSCATQTTTSDLTPWSGGPGGTPDANPQSSYTVDFDGAGGPCPATGQPFVPSFAAGGAVPLAGAFSPFSLTFSRPEGDQALSGLSVALPAGLLGMLSSVPLCQEPQAARGTCPAASRIGTSTVGAGSGSHPYHLYGPVYLTGPYKGAPFGVSVAVPAVAGPFNLGTVVVRAAISVDPNDGHVTATADPLPQIVSGVPTRLQSVTVTLDRPGFMFNPTNCAGQSVTATLGGAAGAGVHVASPFDVAGCQNMPFKPTFKVSTQAKTSKANGASLDAKVTYPASSSSSIASQDANIKSVKVDLPKQLPSRLTTLQKACPAATFAADPATCPAASVVGIVRASTPVLPVTLTGPVYFVSHAGEAFPDLVLVLQGDGVRVDLVASTLIHKGITSSTFKSVPDVPISSFELYLPEGKNSVLAANGDLCKPTKTVTVNRRVAVHRHGKVVRVLRRVKQLIAAPLTMPAVFTGQNGAQIKESTNISVVGCPPNKPKKASKPIHGKGSK